MLAACEALCCGCRVEYLWVASPCGLGFLTTWWWYSKNKYPERKRVRQNILPFMSLPQWSWHPTSTIFFSLKQLQTSIQIQGGKKPTKQKNKNVDLSLFQDQCQCFVKKSTWDGVYIGNLCLNNLPQWCELGPIFPMAIPKHLPSRNTSSATGRETHLSTDVWVPRGMLFGFPCWVTFRCFGEDGHSLNLVFFWLLCPLSPNQSFQRNACDRTSSWSSSED